MATTKTDLSQTAAGIADLLGSVKSMDDYQSLMKDVFKRVAERALQAEMTQHLCSGQLKLETSIDMIG